MCMSILSSPWIAITVAKSGTTSAEVDLEGPCDSVQVIIPTIDTATVALQVALEYDGSNTYYTLGNSQTTVSGTGNYATEFRLGGYRYIKIVCSAAQTTAARTFYVRGRRQ